jgi:hypothetical protein
MVCDDRHRKTEANDQTFTRCPTCSDMVVMCKNHARCGSIANKNTVLLVPPDRKADPHNHWVFDAYDGGMVRRWTCTKCYKTRCQTGGNNWFDRSGSGSGSGSGSRSSDNGDPRYGDPRYGDPRYVDSSDSRSGGPDLDDFVVPDDADDSGDSVNAFKIITTRAVIPTSGSRGTHHSIPRPRSRNDVIDLTRVHRSRSPRHRSPRHRSPRHRSPRHRSPRHRSRSRDIVEPTDEEIRITQSIRSKPRSRPRVIYDSSDSE